MSAGIVFQQMLVVFLLISVGFFMFRAGRFSKEASRDFSGLITNVCNPAVMIGSAMDQKNSATGWDLLTAAAVAAVLYVLLLLLGHLLPKILRVKQQEQASYCMMTVYGNIGFIGIPLISAVLGSQALIFLAAFMLLFNLLIYTHGLQCIAGNDGRDDGFVPWKRMINAGTISGIAAVLLFLLKPEIPVVIRSSVTYMGNCTTFLSLVVLGGSITGRSAREIFGDKRLYLFTALRFFVLPVVAALLLRPLVANELIRGVAVFSLALPVANMPLMLAEEYGAETGILTRGIILTTLFSIVSVTLSAGFI